MTKIPINFIERDSETGEISIHLAADELNADWIHSARLLEEEKKKKFDELDGKPTMQIIEEE